MPKYFDVVRFSNEKAQRTSWIFGLMWTSTRRFAEHISKAYAPLAALFVANGRSTGIMRVGAAQSMALSF